jgi:butyryl-CoA dehydrogenase
MDFSYTARQLELRERAAALTATIIKYEDECEAGNGLTAAVHAELRQAVLDHGLQAINMPAEWGGAGLSILEQVIVQEQLGRLTGALWDVVWRPANALRACTPAQRERFLLPGIRGERRDCVAVTEPAAGSDPQAITTTAVPDGDHYVINGEKWFVTVGDVADYIVLLTTVDGRPTTFLLDKDLPGVRITRVPRYTHTFVYEHPEMVFEDVRVGWGRSARVTS